jgi:hypothetical protein
MTTAFTSFSNSIINSQLRQPNDHLRAITLSTRKSEKGTRFFKKLNSPRVTSPVELIIQGTSMRAAGMTPKLKRGSVAMKIQKWSQGSSLLTEDYFCHGPKQCYSCWEKESMLK